MEKEEGIKAFRTLGEYLRRYKNQIIFGIAALVVVDLAQLIIPQLIKQVIDAITTKEATLKFLLGYAGLIVGLAVFIAVFRFYWRKYIAGTAMKIEELLRNKLVRHLQTLPFSFYDNHKTGDLMAHATNDMRVVRGAIMPGIVILVDIIIMGTIALAFMLSINVTLTLLAILPLPLLAFLVTKFSSVIHKRFEKVQASFANMTAKVSESLSGIRVIKAYTQEEGDTNHFVKQSQDYVDKNINLIKIWGFFFPLLMLFSNGAMMIALWFGGSLVILGDISIGDFVAFQAYLGMLVWPMMAIGWVINLLQRGAASMGRINRLLRERPEPKIQRKLTTLTEIKGELKISNLSFSYPGTNTKVLKNITLDISPGKILGIIGFIGSGKSTLVSLIPRFYEPPPHTIFLDGYDIKNIDLSVIRRSIGFVPQDTFLFSTTVRKNIEFGQDRISPQKVEEVAKLVCIDDEIREFPNGFDTVVGERGVTLSGGQRQRLTIARAILRDPKIFILDDALSSVDADKEAQILKNLIRFMRERTVIIVSQRPRSISLADEIIVLDDGKIIERGSHQELMKLNGVYSLLWNLQGVEKVKV